MDKLISDIRAFCSKADISVATFGAYAAGDGKFVARLESGRECLPRTERKVRAWMHANPPEQVRQVRKRSRADAKASA